MNCDECKEFLGVFMENDLPEAQAQAVRMHLALCEECSAVCEDVAALIDVCATESAAELMPNSKALWCRINNIIESEQRPNEASPVIESRRRKFWQFSFAQLVTVVACIAVISSVATFFAIRSSGPAAEVEFAIRPAPPTLMEKLLSRVGLVETPQQARERKLKERRDAIEYWNARVVQRRQQWDRATREAFDRNLRIIDESVSEYTMILASDPEDELSGEMLDSVLNDKMNLLRDFSDL